MAKKKRLGQVSGAMLRLILDNPAPFYAQCMAEELQRYRRMLSCYKIREHIRGLSEDSIRRMEKQIGSSTPICGECEKLKQQIKQLKQQLNVKVDNSWLLNPGKINHQ